MDKYQETIKKRIRRLGGLAGLFAMANAALNAWSFSGGGHFQDFFHGFTVGMSLAMLFLLVFRMIRYRSALKDEALLKALYIKETDERNLAIHRAAGSFGMNIAMIGLLQGAIISAYFSQTVFITLAAAALFLGVIRKSLTLYYKHKF